MRGSSMTIIKNKLQLNQILNLKEKKTFIKFCMSSVESQKGVNDVQRCSIENQSGALAMDFVQKYF